MTPKEEYKLLNESPSTSTLEVALCELCSRQYQTKKLLDKVQKYVKRCQGKRVNLLEKISLTELSPPLLCPVLLKQNQI